MIFSPKPLKGSGWWLVSFCWWSCESAFCHETTAKHCYEILLFFRFTAWKCFEFVKISKLLAKVTQNFKHRAVFLVTVPGNEAKICPLDSWGLTRRNPAISEVWVWGLAALAPGIGFMIPQISTGTSNSTVSNTAVGFIWGQEGPWEVWERGKFLLQPPLLTYQRNFQAHETKKE